MPRDIMASVNSTPLSPLSRVQRWLLWCVFVLLLLGTPVAFSWLFSWQAYVPVPKRMDTSLTLLLFVGAAVGSGLACGFVAARLSSRTFRDFILNGVAFGTSLAIVEGILIVFRLRGH